MTKIPIEHSKSAKFCENIRPLLTIRAQIDVKITLRRTCEIVTLILDITFAVEYIPKVCK